MEMHQDGCVDGRGDGNDNGHEKRGNGKMGGGGVSLELVGEMEYSNGAFNMKSEKIERFLLCFMPVCLVLKNVDLCLQFVAFEAMKKCLASVRLADYLTGLLCNCFASARRTSCTCRVGSRNWTFG